MKLKSHCSFAEEHLKPQSVDTIRVFQPYCLSIISYLRKHSSALSDKAVVSGSCFKAKVDCRTKARTQTYS